MKKPKRLVVAKPEQPTKQEETHDVCRKCGSEVHTPYIRTRVLVADGQVTEWLATTCQLCEQRRVYIRRSLDV